MGVDVRAHHHVGRAPRGEVHQPRAAARHAPDPVRHAGRPGAGVRAGTKLAEGRDDTWVLASDDPCLPVFYGTINIWSHLGKGERWASVSINQCGQTEDFLLLGELLGKAVAETDRRVVVLASGGMTHRFFPLRELRKHESSKVPDNILHLESYEADQHVLRMLQAGDHMGVIDWMPEYKRAAPEGHFGHYLIMAGAIGGARCQAPGELFSEYEASVGTGQVHVWFERPADGWTGRG